MPAARGPAPPERHDPAPLPQGARTGSNFYADGCCNYTPAGGSTQAGLDGDSLQRMAERLELDGEVPISDRILGLNVQKGCRLSIEDAHRLRAAHDQRRREVALLALLWGVR